MITSYIPHDPGVESYLLIYDAPALGAQNDGAQGERGTNVYENFYGVGMPLLPPILDFSISSAIAKLSHLSNSAPKWAVCGTGDVTHV